MRADLLALTEATLAELTNRGLVKRAARELERSTPELTEDEDGTVRAAFPDGVTTALPVGGFESATCGCGASGTCRHLVGLVLAYKRMPPAAGAADMDAAGSVDAPGSVDVAGSVDAADVTGSVGAAEWSPGEFTDEELVARLGERLVATARRAAGAGYVARVRRGREADPVPSVELPTATVRFLVPKDLGFATTDTVAGVRDDVIALAVWAFRVADERVPELADAQVQVGGEAAPAGGPALEAAVALASTVLLEGAVQLGAGLAGEIAGVRRELDAARLRWPLLALDDLAGQLEAYRDRGARYRPEALADHLAELVARHRAVTGPGAELRSRVLGTDEAAETPLRRARLDGVGARVSAAGDERVVDLFLAHADSATVLVLRRAYPAEEAGPQLAARRVAGVTVGLLASGAVVTEAAARSASRAVRLGARRLSRTEAMASRGSWQHLPPALLAASLDALAAELDALPPRPIRARVQAELVRVIPVASVRSISYAPGAQRLDAVIADATGTTAVVQATHESCAPGRLDSMAEALSAGPRFVSGTVRRGGGGILIDPLAFATADGVVVPDLAAAARGTDPGAGLAPPADPLAQVIDEAVALLAEVAHRGLRHVPSTMGTRLHATAGRLSKLGLRHAAAAVEGLSDLLGPDPGDPAVSAWVDAYLRTSLAAELL
ncbi:hypothetical protein [Actinoplanes sp. NPDC049265]|uniref:hypothetical protein n=1 Tax=Actinoplanes sp. NPDC049265 TaxID=3363902 RepID=UPI00371F3A1A